MKDWWWEGIEEMLQKKLYLFIDDILQLYLMATTTIGVQTIWGFCNTRAGGRDRKRDKTVDRAKT